MEVREAEFELTTFQITLKVNQAQIFPTELFFQLNRLLFYLFSNVYD